MHIYIYILGDNIYEANEVRETIKT